ncbi:MAG: hypothetical protein NDJ89_02860 [Oligoflexia bacterium]|nr:hypothetical protein [Oligoflexia bacterium]
MLLALALPGTGCQDDGASVANKDTGSLAPPSDPGWPTNPPPGWPQDQPWPPSVPGYPGMPGQPSLPSDEEPTSSDGKVLKDLVEGKITNDQAWLYRVQARLNPEAMPQKYLPTPIELPPGVEKPVHDHNTLNPQFVNAVMAELPKLNGDTQRAIIPYLLPPSSPESFFNRPLSLRTQTLQARGIQAGKFSSRLLTTVSGRAALALEAGCPGYGPIPEPIPEGAWRLQDEDFYRVWWDPTDPGFRGGDQAYADMLIKLRRALAAAKPVFEELTGKRILSDAGNHAFIDKDGNAHVWCDGGNGKLDIYIGNVRGHALTVAYPGSCSQQPSFILIDTMTLHVSEKLAKFATAHEFFHVFQFTHERQLPCGEYLEADEGLANWAAHHVFPGNNKEHDYDSFLTSPNWSLLDLDYASWAFFFAAIDKAGTGLIKRLYEAEKTLNPYRALNQVLDGGFRKQWPEIALQAWNQEPSSFYAQKDQFLQTPEPQFFGEPPISREIKLDEKGEFFEEISRHMDKGLTRSYFHYKVAPEVRSFRARWNDAGVDEDDFHLRVMIKRGGNWTTEDWGPKSTRKRKHPRYEEICFEEPGVEGIEEIVFSFSRSEIEAPFGIWSGKAQVRLSIGANNRPCYALQGTATVVRKEVSGTPGSGNYRLRYYNAQYRLGFEAKRGREGFLSSTWKMTQGSGAFFIEAVDERKGPCSGINAWNPLCRVGTDSVGLLEAFFRPNAPEQFEKCLGNGSGSLEINPERSGLELSQFTNEADDHRRYSVTLGNLNPAFSTFKIQCPKEAYEEEIRHRISIMSAMPLKVEPDGHLRGTYDRNNGEKVTWDLAPAR